MMKIFKQTIDSFKELLQYKELLNNLTIKDLKLKYRNSALGFLWSFLNPILMLIVYTFAFKVIMGIKKPNYTVVLLTGLLIWQFFQAAVQGSTDSIVSNSNLIKKVYFPREILPFSVIFSSFINFLITLIILFVIIGISGIKVGATLLLFPVVLLLLLFFAIGLSLFLSSLNVLYRDISHFVEVIFMLWMYLTPVVYPVDLIPNQYRTFLFMNPMTLIVQSARDILIENKVPQIRYLVALFVIDLVLIVWGSKVFRKIERVFAEEI